MGNGITEGETSDKKGGTGSLENLLGEQKTSWFDWNKGHVRGTGEMRLERQSGTSYRGFQCYALAGGQGHC